MKSYLERRKNNMDKNYMKDMLQDIKNLAANGNCAGIIAICDNEIEEIEKRTPKQNIVDAVKLIEDAKYEITRLRHDDTDGLYDMLNNASKILKNLVKNEELNSTATNESV